jgi:hypothetical protein
MKTMHGGKNARSKENEEERKKGRRRTNENRIKLKGSLRRSDRKNNREREIW